MSFRRYSLGIQSSNTHRQHPSQKQTNDPNADLVTKNDALSNILPEVNIKFECK